MPPSASVEDSKLTWADNSYMKLTSVELISSFSIKVAEQEQKYHRVQLNDR